ncbi:LuxR C-terminal-related transcriptional regulator [Arthrobacter sp. TMN-37]
MQAGSLGVSLTCPLRETVAASFLGAADRSAADPHLRLVAGVSGAGGTGKSALLDLAEEHYRAAGVGVVRGPAALGPPLRGTRRAVIIDDAHLLDDAALARISSIIEDRADHVIVSYRTWPRTSGLERLAAVLEQHHPPVVLGPLGSDDLARYLGAALGEPVPPATLELVAELTGGMPWLVQRVTAGLQQQGRGTDTVPEVPRGVMDQLGYELDGVETALRELLLAMAVGFAPPRQVPPGLEGSGTPIDALLAKGRAGGLLLPDGRLVPLIRRALLAATPDYRILELQHFLVDVLTRDGVLGGDVARGLARDGLRHPRVAAALVAAADAALSDAPEAAAALYEEAAAAGTDRLATAARRAQAAAAAGDLDGAGRILDSLLAQEEVPDVARAADVAASVWAQRGMLSRGAEVYRWLGEGRAGSSAALAAVTMIGSGDREGADGMLEGTAPGGSPTLRAVSTALMGRAVLDSLGPSPAQALPGLVRASDMMTASGQSVPLPDLPAALAALAALSSGELDLAQSVLDAALAGGQGGPAARPRLTLLRAWTALQQDKPGEARLYAAEAVSGPGTLAPRDGFFLTALEVALARRTGDVPALVAAWQRAREGILRVSIDLYLLLPLGELLVAGARLRDAERLEVQLAEAWSLLERLGHPPLWSVPLHWAAVQAALLAERPQDLAPHAAALVRNAQGYPLAAVLAAAGRAWISVLAGRFEVSVVEGAARALAAAGFTWDGSRLAGQAAARADDRKDMARLMACARDLHPVPFATAGTQSPRAAAGTAAPEPRLRAGAVSDESGLSAREREVAQLVLEGRTYREIGQAIFISPRTAEHHIARIRRRLGVTTRAELLDRLRIALVRAEEGEGS